MTELDVFFNEMVRRTDIVEFFNLKILVDNNNITKEVYHCVMSALKTINPKNDYGNVEYREKRFVELRNKYFDEFGRMLNDS